MYIRPTFLIAPLLFFSSLSLAADPRPEPRSAIKFFERLDSNGDGMVTLAEAPPEGRMLVEFLLSQAGKKSSAQLDRDAFMLLANNITATATQEKGIAAALGAGEVQPAPENCPACAMGLTAEFVFRRLDSDQDKLVSITEFMRSPGMQDLTIATETVGRLDQSGDGKLSWEELETAYAARHANCAKPNPATLAAAEEVGADGRGNGNRFAQVFLLRSDQDGDGQISQTEFRGPAFGFKRLDKDENGFIDAQELGELHQQRLNDPKSMQERIESGDLPQPPQGIRRKDVDDPNAARR